MSHELRTPMHAIISFANFGVDKSERAERDKLLHYFRNIQKSGGRLLTLLNDLLDLSKLEAGKMTMQRQTAELRVLVDEAFAESEALARARGVTLRSGIPGSVAARFDLMRMLQVMRNLLSNAIKFSPEGGVVDVDCVMVAAEDAADRVCAVEIRVRDQGIGIPVAELEAVFDKFVQSSKTKTGAGGTGLGLAICREIVAAHGGAIHAENNPPPASGATFVVRLPIAEAAGRGADEPAGPGAAALAGADH
jgi:signal transduction histidine kinase